MEKINISKKDVLWGYLAQFFVLSSNLIILPLILRFLTADEIGLNYILITVGSLVSLLDFGFSPQFSRNITYVFSGIQTLNKEGININDRNDNINYRLLATLIDTAKNVYSIISVIVLILMFTLGTIYIGKITNGFTKIENSLLIWIVYTISVFFNIYYTYFSSLLIGKGLIKEYQSALVFSKIAYIFLVLTFLFCKMGLLSIALANLIAPFVFRFFSYKFFFSKELKLEINKYTISKNEKIDLLNVIWYNSKKLGLVVLGSFAISKLGMFLAGIYLPLQEIGSFGLMTQLFSFLMTLSSVSFSIYQPRFASLRAVDNKNQLLNDFSFTMMLYYLIFILGALIIIISGPNLLNLIGSNTFLPIKPILILYALIIFLEGNHSNFANFIVTGNTIPFVKPALIVGTLIGVFSFLSLKYTSMGVLGLILIQGTFQLAYSNWKWPYVVCKEFNISFLSFLNRGTNELSARLTKKLINKNDL